MKIYPFFLAMAGCPGRCLYCRQEVTAAAPLVTTEAVADELERQLPVGGVDEVAFFGGSFTFLPPETQRALLAAVAPFLETQVRGVRVSTRPDGLSAAAVELLRAGGVTTVEIGCQSFSPAVLQASGRGHDAVVAKSALARVRNAGLQVGLQLMPFLPGGDTEEALDSLRQALALHPDFVRIYPTVVLRGTELAERWSRGDYHAPELDTAVECCADMLECCRAAAVPVIRLGLHGDHELTSGDGVVAGPFHPAFGQLVRSRLWRRALVNRSESQPSTPFRVHPADLADAIGHRRENLLYLRRSFPQAHIVGDALLPRSTLAVAAEVHSLQTLPSP